MANDDLPLKDTFVRFTGGEVDVTVDGQAFKAQVGLIGDGRGTPIEAGIVVLRLTSDIAAVDDASDHDAQRPCFNDPREVRRGG